MTAPNPARVRTCYIGQLNAIEDADNVVNEVASVLATPFRPLGVFYQVITALTGAAVTVTLNWRPTPGSATGEKLLATWEQPVQAVDTQGYVDFNENDDATGTSVGTGGPASQYGIDGSTRFEGGIYSQLVCGPGGELEIDAPGGEADAGAVEYWLVYEQLDFADEQVTTFTRVVPDVVGA